MADEYEDNSQEATNDVTVEKLEEGRSRSRSLSEHQRERAPSRSKSRSYVYRTELYVDGEDFFYCGGKCGERVCKSKYHNRYRKLIETHSKCFDANTKPFFKLR